jgi:glucose/arabinose dehydrogenase/mono/diheme cytochrome c family protein
MPLPFCSPSLFRTVIIALSLASCKNRSAAPQEQSSQPDSASVALGNELFTQNCSSCHTFKDDGIGPQLGGVTKVTSTEWVKNFIKNPKTVIESGDPRAALLHKKFKSTMPSFAHLKDEDINHIIDFLSVQKLNLRSDLADPNALQDPIPDSIAMSDLIIKAEEVTTIPRSAQQGQLTRICKLDFRPDTKQLFVVDLRGKLYALKNGKPNVYLDMKKERPNFINTPGLATGFGSFAFHPEFDKNGLLYTTHTESAGSAIADFTFEDSIKVTLQWVLTEWKTENPGAFAFRGSSRELLRVNMPHQFHGFQELTFNPTATRGSSDLGLLYLGIGDGGSVEFGHPWLVHSTQQILGTIIRIDPSGTNSKNGKYGIPSSNPFANNNDPNTVKEIYAYGFRNPHRISWTQNGKMMCSNIGHHNIESLYAVLPGRDHGWPIREGSFMMDIQKGMNNVYSLPEDDKRYNINYPIAQYDHDEGNAISGGFEYTGKNISELKGKYLFGDVVNGRLFYIDLTTTSPGSNSVIHEWRFSLKGKVKTLQELCGHDKVDVRFGKDSTGEIYVLTKPDGKIYKLTKATTVALHAKI